MATRQQTTDRERTATSTTSRSKIQPPAISTYNKNHEQIRLRYFDEEPYSVFGLHRMTAGEIALYFLAAVVVVILLWACIWLLSAICYALGVYPQ